VWMTIDGERGGGGHQLASPLVHTASKRNKDALKSAILFHQMPMEVGLNSREGEPSKQNTSVNWRAEREITPKSQSYNPSPHHH
jgi:hypothetical protein